MSRAATAALTSAESHEALEILRREPNRYASTFSSEIVSCRIRGERGGAPYERALTAFVKSGPAYVDRRTGHRRGVPYEIDVYRGVLPLLPSLAPSMLGTFAEPGAEKFGWLFTEYLGDAVRLDQRADPGALRAAAQTLGLLHAAGQDLVAARDLPSLNGYGRRYLVRWSRHWVRKTADLRPERPWIERAAGRLDEIVGLLEGAQPTLVHGEAYPGNVQLREGRALMVDWESLGVGAGEIDLGMLLLGWSAETIEGAEAAYVEARWPEGPPRDFHRRLLAARLHALGHALYHRLRRDGGDPWASRGLLEESEAISERLGILR